MATGYGDIGERCLAVAMRLEAAGALADAGDVRALVEERNELLSLLGSASHEQQGGN